MGRRTLDVATDKVEYTYAIDSGTGLIVLGNLKALTFWSGSGRGWG